jgi:hypothetical protein
MTVHQLKSNGVEYGGVVNEWFVGYYRGRRRLCDLNVRPFSTCSKKSGKAIKSGLIQRGRKWEKLVQNQFMRVHIGDAPMCQPEETSGAWPSHHGVRFEIPQIYADMLTTTCQLFDGWEDSGVQSKAHTRAPRLPTQVVRFREPSYKYEH